MPSQEQLELKKQIVEEIKSKITSSKSLVLVDYMGLTVKEDTDLRNEYRKNGCDYQVLKNRLVYKAFHDLGYTEFDDALNGPTAIAFANEDAVAPAKIATTKAKDLKKTKIKCGMVGGKFIDANGVQALATLPSREVIIATLLGTMQAPISGLARVLNGTIAGLAICLNKIAEQKQ